MFTLIVRPQQCRFIRLFGSPGIYSYPKLKFSGTLIFKFWIKSSCEENVVCDKNLSTIIILHDNGEETHWFSVKCFHAVWEFSVEIETVTFVQYQVFTFYIDQHTAFEY